ncbi:MAG TPA: hypothetical protein VFX58_04655 [Chitinophagaceae bacterium]|nr:hypothetical protein [Chitinophagaceae bacterium]
MKKTIGMMGGFALSMLFLTAAAQEPVTTPTTTPTTVWDAKKNPTVDSINAKYKDLMIPAREPMTIDKIFPVIGQYQSTVNTDAPAVTITLDPENKGMIWVEGVPQGKIKAMLRKSPSTYKIPVQKTEDGKEVKEGTLVFDKDANTLNIVIGTPYNAEDPLAVFNTATEEPVVAEVKTKGSKTKVKTKAKVKPWTYSGSKLVVETASTTTSNQ